MQQTYVPDRQTDRKMKRSTGEWGDRHACVLLRGLEAWGVERGWVDWMEAWKQRMEGLLLSIPPV